MFLIITVFLETAFFEAVGQDDVEGVENEANALESVTLKAMFWLVGLDRRLGPAYQESWYLCGNGKYFAMLRLAPMLASLVGICGLEPYIWALEELEQEPAVFQSSLFCLSFQSRCFFRYRIIIIFRYTTFSSQVDYSLMGIVSV